MDSPDLQALMPPLPRPDDAPMPEGGASFEDRVLLLLAGVARADGILTYPEYEWTAAMVADIFGERALSADMQARFHHALLHPPADPLALAASLAREAVEERVSGEQVEALLRGLDAWRRRRDQVDDVARLAREAIDLAFAEEHLARRRQRLEKDGLVISGLDLSARLSLRAGKAAMGGAAHLVRNVVDAAQKVLPHMLSGQSEEGVPPSSPLAAFNTASAARLDVLSRAAWALQEDDLRRDVAEFRRLLEDQPFRVAVLGEGKRGKSSLVNALLGEALAPVRESVPETSAVAEFFYAARPSYAVRFLDEEEWTHLEHYLAGEADNPLLAARVESLRSLADGEKPRGIATLASFADVADYLAADGRYAALTARVSIGLPLEFLSGGLVLVDTPGLNATDSFQDYLAYEECLRADCLIFVLDARRPDSGSELRLLRKLAASGRAVSIIGVLTGADRLNDEASRRLAAERALTFLREACRGAEELRVLGLVDINAREAMRERVEGRPGKDVRRSLDALSALLREAAERDTHKDAYRARVAARIADLETQARERAALAFGRYRASLPPAPFLELLERHAERLAEAAASYAERANSLAAVAAHDVEAWRVAQWRALDAWEDTLVLRVMTAAHRHADTLGENFAKESAWKEFDEDEAPRIARQCLDELLTEQQDILRGWQEKLRLFNEELHSLSVLCLTAVEESAAELGDICAASGTMDHLLVKSNAHMRRLAVFLTGAGAGALAAGTLLNLVTLGGAAFLLLTNPIVLPGAAILGVAAYALHSMGNAEKRKAAFLERKKKKTAAWATGIRELVDAELRGAREEVAAHYKTAVARGFVPALEILAGEAAHLRLYLQVMDHIREDADAFEQRLTAELAPRP